MRDESGLLSSNESDPGWPGLTWDDEEKLLGSDEMFVPTLGESDQDKHQPLGVVGRPAEEEGHHHHHWQYSEYSLQFSRAPNGVSSKIEIERSKRL